LYEKFPGQTWLVRLTTVYNGCVHPRKKPIREALIPLKRAYEAGLHSGDIEFSMMCLNVCAWFQFDSVPLPMLDREIREAVDLMDSNGQIATRDMIRGVAGGVELDGSCCR
jgi:hypothetical protein